MKNPTHEYRWKEYCKVCNRKHIYHVGKCPSCGVYETPQPVSENVIHWWDECDGCEAYRDHMR